ncbi:hypothetical protein ACIBEJ_34865 [Nonomuraea sp. NPDC050790]|uniref:hypothetical protein n=1 Tax=Nonomuraea sp. NPDC050790 TaxID=3364371 RepID=UPI0037B32B81
MTPAELIAQALDSHLWDSTSRYAAHKDHNYYGACGVCRGDVEMIAGALLHALAAAGMVVVSTCACGEPLGTCHACGEPRCWHCDPGLGKHHTPMKCNELHEPSRTALPERSAGG